SSLFFGNRGMLGSIIKASIGALTEVPRLPRFVLARRLDGRSPQRGEESPGSTEVRCRVTPGGGDPRESATESTPPACLRFTGRAARVKRCGKSAPRRRQRWRQGKPHREQDQVGVAGAAERSATPGGPPRRRSGRSQEALGDGRPRGMAITAPDNGAGQNPAYTPAGRVRMVDIFAEQHRVNGGFTR